MKTILQIALGVAILGLAFFLYNSLMDPIRFNNEVEKRKELVVQRLKEIRELEIVYKDRYEKFTGSFDTLIMFYKQDSLKIVRQVGSFDDSVAVAQKRVYRDTIAIAVKDSMFKNIAGFNIDSLRYIPLVKGAEFNLEAVMYPSISKIDIPLFEAKVTNDVYLKGLDRQAVVNLNDKHKSMKKYAGLKVGSVTQPNNNAGNWE